jgi:hypothetical protein
VFSNNFRVVVDISATVLSVRNGLATGVVGGGGFDLTNGVTLTANSGVFIGYNSSILIDFALASPNSSTIVGNISIPTIVDNAPTVRHIGTGVLNVIGNVFANQRSANSGILMSSTGTLNFTGILYSTTTVSSTAVPIRINGASIVNVTGDLIWQCSVLTSNSPLILEANESIFDIAFMLSINSFIDIDSLWFPLVTKGFILVN